MNRKEFLTTLACGGTAAMACGTMPCCVAAGPAIPAAEQNKPEQNERAKFADAWVRRLMVIVDSQMDPPAREKFMESNGRACYASQHGQSAAETPPGALDQLIVRLRKWAGEEGVYRKANTVYFTYGPAGANEKRCLCPLVENVSSGLSPTYCHCSVGSVKEMFERAAGKPVEVTLAESLKRGGKACRFLIRV